MPNANQHQLYFDNGSLKPKPNYVAWVDMMGARNAMAQSLASSANHIGRIHAAILLAKTDDVRVYPVMDGAYITAEKKKAITGVLTNIFMRCAEYFAATEEPEHRFLMRGGLAYGPVIHGGDITKPCNDQLGGSGSYKDNLLFGIPMIQSNRAEGFAPPFGIYLDESSRAFANTGSSPLSGVWFKWWNAAAPLPQGFTERLREHLKWCKENWRRIEYREDRLKEHPDMAIQYFGLTVP